MGKMTSLSIERFFGFRSCRYRLNHVQFTPKVTTDAKDKMLEFIRSRPPLRPVSERVLAPRKRKESTARELVLEEIVSGHGKEALKKVKRRSSLQKKMQKEKLKQNSSNNLLEKHEVEREKGKKTKRKADKNEQTKPKTVHFGENVVVSERRRSSLKPVQKTSPESKAVMKTLEKEQRKRKTNGVK